MNNDINCFSCKQSLSNALPTLSGDAWTAQCPACSVVNKLTPLPDSDGHFTVSGAFFVVRRPISD